MKRVVSATLIAATGIFTLQLSAQNPTADQVIEKHVAALGGRAAMEKLTSRVGKGTFEIPDMGLTGTAIVSEKAPNMSLAVIEIPGMGTVREGTDGKAAWEDNPQSGLRDKSGSELADALRGAAFNAELKLRTLYKTIEVVGKEKVGAADAIVLQMTPTEGAASKMYFDTATGLMIRQTTTRESPMGPMAIEVFFEDYKAVDGVKQAHTIRQVTPQFTLLIRIAEIRHNVPLDDAIFKRPGL